VPVPTIQSRRVPSKGLVLLCGKCARKLEGGYGPDGKARLKAALRRELKAAELRRDIRLVETRCLGVCPKKATTMIVADRPGEVLVVPQAAPLADVLKRILEPAKPAA
jgi:hypothetical protein